MYQKYQTEAIVLKSYEQGEADKTFALFTREFGLVRARATAVRTEKSKMRYALQTLSRSNVSLVKGKRGWRLAGASAIASATREPLALSTFARIAELVLRLVHGEETNEYLFEALANAHAALFTEAVSDAFVIMVEIICVARVLYSLGYLSSEALGRSPTGETMQTTLFAHTGFAEPHLAEADSLREELLSSINRAIAETQL